MSSRVPITTYTDNPIALADWLEISALTAPDKNASHSDLERALNRLGAENIEDVCSKTMREIHKRVEAAGINYPFSFSGSLLRAKARWQRFSPYVFCLLLSYCEEEDKQIVPYRHTVMFEILSCLAAKNYIGGKVLRFGSPRDDLPPGFAAALQRISQEVGEWNLKPNSGVSKAKDDGLDVVAWKAFPDRQIGKLILFGHCASGKNWEDKINELQPNNFCSAWLSGEKSPIVKTFFIPHRLNSEDFEQRAVSAKLFFDRCRIAFWVPQAEFCKKTNSDCIKWCNLLLRKVTS